MRLFRELFSKFFSCNLYFLEACPCFDGIGCSPQLRAQHFRCVVYDHILVSYCSSYSSVLLMKVPCLSAKALNLGHGEHIP